MKSFLHFIQYHNSAVLLVGLLIGFSGTAFAANELLRDSQPSPQAVTKPTQAEVDTSLLRGRNIDAMDFAMRVVSTKETDNGYQVTYAYTTLAIKNGAWQEVDKTGELNVPYDSLKNTTLERYALVQLGEVITRERQFLVRAQLKAKEQYALESGRNVTLLSGLSVTEDSAQAASEENLKDRRDTAPLPVSNESGSTKEDRIQQSETAPELDQTSTTTTSASSSATASSSSAEMQDGTQIDDGSEENPEPATNPSETNPDNSDEVPVEDTNSDTINLDEQTADDTTEDNTADNENVADNGNPETTEPETDTTDTPDTTETPTDNSNSTEATGEPVADTETSTDTTETETTTTTPTE